MEGRKSTTCAWLLISVSSGSSSTLRVRAWRTLRALGAVYVQNSVCLLPARPQVGSAVRRLQERITREGGEARIMHISLTTESEEQELLERFSAERADEYREVCERTPQFLEEIASERRRGRATYTEVEESEADLRRLQRWLERIKSRDYFGAPGRDEAEAAVAACAKLLAEFEAEAFAREGSL